MQLRSLRSFLLKNFCFISIVLTLICMSCNEKPKFKKKHYTTKRVVRNYKKVDSLIATADIKKTPAEEKIKLTPSPIQRQETKVTVVPQTPAISIKTINKKQNKYYIIAASYSVESKAKEVALEYIRLGFPVEIIAANNKYRITLNSHRNRYKAISLRDSLRIKLNRNDLWLLRY